MRLILFAVSPRGVAARALAVALLSLPAMPPLARAQSAAPADDRPLPAVDVVGSRLGGGIIGTSTTIITGEEIARSPSQSLPELLSQQPGIQIQHTIGGVSGARDMVDLRGFGASAPSNVLVLVNGRRFNDFDLQGFDFAAIPLNGIERIEITRGGSGAVLYGDGAVGGVINIVTKTGANLPPSARIDGAFGSFRYRDGRFSGHASAGPLSVAASGLALDTDGYRENGALRQRGAVGDVRYTTDAGSVFFNITADDQRLGLPGGRRVTLTTSQLVTDRRGTATPLDFGNKQGQNYTAGVTRLLAPGAEIILDGSVRRKAQQTESFFAGTPFSGIASDLTTASVTPRLRLDGDLAGMPVKALTGIDVYRTSYQSTRAQDLVSRPFHVYDIHQGMAAVYGNATVGIRPDTDVTVGGRYQRNTISARDAYDPTAPGAFDMQGLPLDRSEWQYAAQAGFEHRFNAMFAVFGHVARSFRVPNADERVAASPFGVPANFELRTQTSHEVEGGVRGRFGRLDWQASVYDMSLENEVFFSPATFTNINLDPTHRYGAEGSVAIQVTDTLRLKGSLTHTRAVFREGPFAGNDVPLVSRWTANAGVSWNVWDKYVVYDAIVRYSGRRRLDNDAANFQPLIPAHTVIDMRIGGEFQRLYWSVAVQNVFNELYYDYGIASATTFGTFNAYPQPGRTFLVRLGAIFE
jgi:iron complex outermembrane receptor protein